ncbi:DUF1365 domain-containing protein [Micromonospora sp. B006]|uniref:DUF1365 domain-containing protein n=1 Tax=Micromonospora sp. B006 TaxID=2201999 RepID=UPI000E30414D|nr:DUF1365 domain-containing protein [Micromonospora sp. B006]
MSAACLYECVVRHRRLTPVRYGFRHRTYLWLVDLDDLPVLPWWLRPIAGFRADDHLGPAGGPLRTGVDENLAAHGIDLRGGRIHMLTQARVAGHVFNPLTLYWCWYADGTPAAVIAEVRNTYGGWHRYVLYPDARWRAEVAKSFPVSPFFPVDGSYLIRVPPPGERLAVGVTLRRDGAAAFVADITGRRHPGTTGSLLRLAARHPLATVAVSAGIRFHGIRLFLLGLPTHPHATTARGDKEEQ